MAHGDLETGKWLRASLLIALGALVAVIAALAAPESRTGLIALAIPIIGTSAWCLAKAMRQLDKMRGSARARKTDRADLKDQIKRAESAFQTLFEGLHSLTLIVDPTKTIVAANHAFRTGFGTDSPVGQKIVTVTFSEDLDDIVDRVIEFGRGIDEEIVLRHPTERHALVSAWRSSDDPQRIVVSMLDTTEQKRVERMRTDFVANASHELRTPLTTIRAMAETIQDDPSDIDTTKRFVEKMMKETDRLSQLTADLLTLSYVESHDAEKSVIDLSEICQEEVEFIREKSAAKGLQLSSSIEEDISVRASASQMQQVVVNLIVNAVSYTDDGSVTVTLAKEHDQAVFSVKDTGPGIPSQHIERIFERFYRIDKGRTRAAGGTGLGLSIVRHITESHGGSIDVESELNKGSVFTVRLPLA